MKKLNLGFINRFLDVTLSGEQWKLSKMTRCDLGLWSKADFLVKHKKEAPTRMYYLVEGCLAIFSMISHESDYNKPQKFPTKNLLLVWCWYSWFIEKVEHSRNYVTNLDIFKIK